jgi:hypothetical protein
MSRAVYFNAPAMTHADIVQYPGLYEADEQTPGEQKRALTVARKGWLTPDVMFFKDWTIDDGEKTGDDDGEQAGTDASEQVINMNTLFAQDQQYGFRFMYNPTSIGFVLGRAEGVNSQFIMSGADKATPQVPTGSTISLKLTISRVDDLAAIYGFAGHRPLEGINLDNLLPLYGRWGSPEPGEPHKSEVGGLRPPYSKNDEEARDTSYNVRVETDAVRSQISEIARLGTMHDLNYLFRAMIARDIKTTYRGTTSDIGIGFSVPMALNLGNDNMMYRVKLNSLSFTHILFNPSMIPMITDVSLTLDRIPDAIEWTGTGTGTSAPSISESRRR